MTRHEEFERFMALLGQRERIVALARERAAESRAQAREWYEADLGGSQDRGDYHSARADALDDFLGEVERLLPEPPDSPEPPIALGPPDEEMGGA